LVNNGFRISDDYRRGRVCVIVVPVACPLHPQGWAQVATVSAPVLPSW
jgi:hypothetical protein